MTARVLLALEGALARRVMGKDCFTLVCPRFDIARGDRIALVGPSGSGKTALLELLGLLVRPETVHRFELRPLDAPTLDLAALVRDAKTGYARRTAPHRAAHIAIVPQRGGLLPFLSARRNILTHPGLAREPVEATTARLEALAALLDLGRCLDRKPGALSGGEANRVALARALIARPALLLADEPTAALDVDLKRQVLSQLTDAAHANGTAVVIATHDRDLADAAGFALVERQSARVADDGPAASFARTAG